MTSTSSPSGRRILVAVVTGAVGERIQAWRRKHDPEQAERLPPHATLCYWAPVVEAELLEQQVRHAFPGRLNVGLGGVLEGDNDQETFYVEVRDAQGWRKRTHACTTAPTSLCRTATAGSGT